MNERAGVGCKATDTAAAGFRLYIASIDTGTTQPAASLRALWHIAPVAAIDIQFVSDSLSCDRAAKAHAVSIQGDTTNPPEVHLLRVGGGRFIAFNFTTVGEWLHYVILDSTFAVIGTRGS